MTELPFAFHGRMRSNPVAPPIYSRYIHSLRTYLHMGVARSRLLTPMNMALKSGRHENEADFKSIQILKDQRLHMGGYGDICKAKCDDLICAAKRLHPVLFIPSVETLRPPRYLRRFQQECEILSTLRHPNIVQYIGVYRGPESEGVAVLLMELMD